MVADQLRTRIDRLKREMRSRRRWHALELGLGVLVVGLAVAAVVWFWQANARRDGATEPVGEGRVHAAPHIAPPITVISEA